MKILIKILILSISYTITTSAQTDQEIKNALATLCKLTQSSLEKREYNQVYAYKEAIKNICKSSSSANIDCTPFKSYITDVKKQNEWLDLPYSFNFNLPSPKITVTYGPGGTKHFPINDLDFYLKLDDEDLAFLNTLQNIKEYNDSFNDPYNLNESKELITLNEKEIFLLKKYDNLIRDINYKNIDTDHYGNIKYDFETIDDKYIQEIPDPDYENIYYRALLLQKYDKEIQPSKNIIKQSDILLKSYEKLKSNDLLYNGQFSNDAFFNH